MEESTYKLRVQRLQEVNKVVSKLDPAIREAAFDTLRDYVVSVKSGPDPGGKKPREGGTGGGAGQSHEVEHDLKAKLLGEHPDAKPAENVKIAAAVWFSQYGTAAFSTDGLREIASDMGITLPDRPDATIRAARHEKKPLFKSAAGKGFYAPTVHGQTYLKEAYGVKQGTDLPPEQS